MDGESSRVLLIAPWEKGNGRRRKKEEGREKKKNNWSHALLLDQKAIT
jgi:hypothetical protein